MIVLSNIASSDRFAIPLPLPKNRANVTASRELAAETAQPTTPASTDRGSALSDPKVTVPPLGPVDPRLDLAADSAWWSILLQVAHEKDPDPTSPLSLCGALHALRCEGAGLARIGAVMHLTRGALSDTDYADRRQRWLVPQGERLVGWLREAGREARDA